MNTMRSTVIAASLFGAVAAGAMGLMTFGGETHEASTVSACTAADWPLIPADCLEGASSRPVRVIGANLPADANRLAMQARFETAFE